MKLLDRAAELIASVNYSVTLRWVFYGLWQEGWFSDKKPTARASAKRRAYEDFTSLASRLRHSGEDFNSRWAFELADDRRDPIVRTTYFRNTAEWLAAAIEQLSCNIDKMTSQNNYVVVAFEAEAMQSQFKYYTESYGVSLWPFSGAASIPYKKRLAREIDYLNERFGLPVTILYFGDYDPKGLEIPETAFRHVRKWCDCEFEAYRAGLNIDQIDKYNIIDDPEKPGRYQWEAIGDRAAKEIITGALEKLLCHETILKTERDEEAMTLKVREALGALE